MITSGLTLLGLLLSAALYFTISWRVHGRTKRLDDHFPLNVEGSEARVASAGEFSAATVATTISLATVILAYTELAAYMGTWLFWTVLTTGAGIYMVRLAARRIWRRLNETKTYRPTLHDFLGASFGSPLLVTTAALCTSLGFVGAFAVELTVGATFLNALVPALPAVVGLLILASIGVGYTVLGGFRAVILTDRVQMRAIWLSIVALGIAIVFFIRSAGGSISAMWANAPPSLYDFSNREGLIGFVIGILIINVPTYLADMSVWQRIAGSRTEATVTEGLTSSVSGAIVSWSAFAAIACTLVLVVTPVPNENPLVTFLRAIGRNGNLFSAALFLIVITGLYAASLSTASTQLVAAGQALHMDVLRGRRDRSALAQSDIELVLARRLLFAVAAISILLVWGLQVAGFTIADLVFAVYGAQLGMVPAVIAALFLPPEVLRRLGRWAWTSVLIGFVTGWATAGYGKWLGDANVVFLAPAASLSVSTVILGVGFLARGDRKPHLAKV